MISDHNRKRSVPNDTRVAEKSGQNAPRKTIPDESQTPTTSGGPESRMLQAPCQLYRGKETTQFDCLITSIVTTVSAALVVLNDGSFCRDGGKLDHHGKRNRRGFTTVETARWVS